MDNLFKNNIANLSNEELIWIATLSSLKDQKDQIGFLVISSVIDRPNNDELLSCYMSSNLANRIVRAMFPSLYYKTGSDDAGVLNEFNLNTFQKLLRIQQFVDRVNENPWDLFLHTLLKKKFDQAVCLLEVEGLKDKIIPPFIEWYTNNARHFSPEALKLLVDQYPEPIKLLADQLGLSSALVSSSEMSEVAEKLPPANRTAALTPLGNMKKALVQSALSSQDQTLNVSKTASEFDKICQKIRDSLSQEAQIEEINQVITSLREGKDKDLPVDEKLLKLHEFLQDIKIEIGNERNAFASRLLTVCDDLQKGLEYIASLGPDVRPRK